MVINLEWLFTICLFTLVIAKMFLKYTHHNMLYFEGVDSISWSQDDYAITSGQPFVNASAKGSAIDVLAGRLKGIEAMKRFRNGLEGVNMLPTTQAFGVMSRGVPHLLDFAVFGTMTFTINGKQFKCENMRLGEGGYPFVNNWWIGGPTCHRDKRKTTLTCGHRSSCGLTFQAVPRSHGDHFKVRLSSGGDAAPVGGLTRLRRIAGNYSGALTEDSGVGQHARVASFPVAASSSLFLIVFTAFLSGALFMRHTFKGRAHRDSTYYQLSGEVVSVV